MHEFSSWRVEDVMSAPVCIGPDATLADAESFPVVLGLDRKTLYRRAERKQSED